MVVRHHPDLPDPRLIREIQAGMEEEGVPFRTDQAHDDHGRLGAHGGEAAALAYAAAQASALDVGVGVDARGTICVHHAKLPPAAPALTGPASAARVLGHNAARIVVGLPLRPLPAPALPIPVNGDLAMPGRLSLDQARVLLDTALAKADAIGVPINVAVADDGGHLLAFARQDGAILASVDIAIRKARTAVLLRMTTDELGKAAAVGGPLYGIEGTNGGLVVFGGGIPLFTPAGDLLGAIGVSGGTVEQDITIAQAGADHLGATATFPQRARA